jgi:hypothetical protein
MLKKTKIIAEWIVLVLFLLSYLAYMILNIGNSRLNQEIDISAQYIIIGLIAFFVILAPLRRTSNVVLFLLLATATGIMTGVLTPLVFLNFSMMNFVLICLIYLVVFIKSFFVIKSNGFLKWLVIIASMIILLYLTTFLARILYGSDIEIIRKFNNFFFIIYIGATLAMIFGLPNSNYAEWIKEHRQIFARLILSIWIFIFVLSTINLFIPLEKYSKVLFPELNDKWGMKTYQLEEKPGLKD